ncbi:uncharacterized protein EV154DRAFT_594387 [Mucor mucedo]|uniref:uncharacterized protein n=1 Tax=Mucor mucedo TaxID=29922 RepID=UPI00221ECC70|nr:uncharacterized protein EV154DRAFT_594387 [Mucor mucedo]KAI7895755.1 hypothetical protein EV154DRAFT_594387 [Mucor mucedo]
MLLFGDLQFFMRDSKHMTPGDIMKTSHSHEVRVSEVSVDVERTAYSDINLFQKNCNPLIIGKGIFYVQNSIKPQCQLSSNSSEAWADTRDSVSKLRQAQSPACPLAYNVGIFGGVVETSKVHFNESTKLFQDCDFNISRSLATENSYKPNKGKLSKLMIDDDHEHGRRIVKSCLGAIETPKRSCYYFMERQPDLLTGRLLSDKVIVITVRRFLNWIKCDVKVDINPILGNKERAKMELKKSRIIQGLESKSNGDFFEEFNKIKIDFPNFIIFSSPEMTKCKLPFDKHPTITDFTYKAVSSGYYLASSVIYVEKIKKYSVFSSCHYLPNCRNFAFYFKALFKKCAINPKFFFYIILDFSKTEQRGFQQACKEHFNTDD